MSAKLSGTLSQLERDIARISKLVRGLEEISVPSAAKLLKKPAEWVRINLPVIVHGPKSYHVRLVEIEAYQQRRTLLPPATTPTGRPRRTR
jgi:hypothetical protein